MPILKLHTNLYLVGQPEANHAASPHSTCPQPISETALLKVLLAMPAFYAPFFMGAPAAMDKGKGKAAARAPVAGAGDPTAMGKGAARAPMAAGKGKAGARAGQVPGAGVAGARAPAAQDNVATGARAPVPAVGTAGAGASVLQCRSPPCQFSNRHCRPTRIELPSDIAVPGHIWIASADWAVHEPFLQEVGVVLLWEALDDHCRHRVGITRAVAKLTPRFEHLRWGHSVPSQLQIAAGAAFARILEVLMSGGSVVVFCVESKHRSVGSLVSFLIGACGLDYVSARGVILQHQWQQLYKYRLLQQLMQQTSRRLLPATGAARAASSSSGAAGAAPALAAGSEAAGAASSPAVA
jgi:hypothetical protein